MKVNMLLAYISTHLVTELCFLFAFKKGYLSCPHIVLKWKQSLSECGWKFMQWPGSCWSAWGPQSSWLWHDGQRPILCHTFTKPKGTWSYLLWTITWIIRTSDVCFWALHINSRNEGKFIFLCKNSIWFLGSVNPNLLSKHQLLFKRGHRIAKHSFFFVLPISLHLFCQREESTSMVKKQKMLFGDVRVSSCPVHSQTAEGDSLLLNVSTLLEYNVCSFCIHMKHFIFHTWSFLCPFETIYNKHFVNDSPTCWVLVLQRWRTCSGQHSVKKIKCCQ